MADTFTIKTMWNGKNRDVHITNSGSAVGNTDRNCVANALLGKDYHQTSKAKNIPQGADAYLHCKSTNTLYALKKSDVHSDQDKATAGTDVAITITFKVLGVGSVNANVHKF
jgi:hypothetical protein